MKTRNTLARTPLLMLLSLSLILQALEAQNNTEGTDQNKSIDLSGSTVKTEDIAMKVDAIFVGQIVDIGSPMPGALGQAVYYGVKVNVLQILRGTVDANVTVTLYVTRGMNVHEEPPKTGNSYIFFINEGKERIFVRKLLPATDSTTATIKKLIPVPPGK